MKKVNKNCEKKGIKMELNEFAKLLASGSTNNAKNTLSYLIGNGQSNSNWNKALAELYKSFPLDLKTSLDDKKEFFPIILKYFGIYELTLDNIGIYKEYEDFFSAKNKDDLKKKNPNWQWENEPEIIFKNALAFTSAIPNGYRDIEKQFDFIQRYERQFSVFISKQKDKIFKHFTNKRIWQSLMKEDYYQFVQLCDNYNFDRIEILKESITNYTNLYDKQIFETENVNFYLDDLMKVGKESLKIIPGFYPDSEWHVTNKNNACSVISVIFDCIGNHQYKSAMKWMVLFDNELKNYAKLYKLENLHTSESFKKMLVEQIKMLKDRNNHFVNAVIYENILKNENWFRFIDSFELFDNLNENLGIKTKTKLPKI